MGKHTELSIRLKERIRVYRDSGGCNSTYADLAHFAEDMLELIESTNELGFNSTHSKRG